MRDSLKSLMEHCIGLKYSLPNTGSSIPKITGKHPTPILAV